MNSYLEQIFSYFKNLTLNAVGVERTLYKLIEDKDIITAIGMMQNRDDEVDIALEEYNPLTHNVMNRPNKSRKKGDDYITEKLPRARQRYINDVELFFMFGKPIKWGKKNGDDIAYSDYLNFIKNQRFNAIMRTIKRIAGAETEAAKLYHIYRDENERPHVKTVILARSTGYRLRPLFDQYGTMLAFAYGYILRESGKNVQHWDIQTPEMLFYCKKGKLGWEVEYFKNPTGKINVIYYKQPKAWDGVEHRINREEMLDSKLADTNNYFADPIASATADVIASMLDPESVGKLIQLTGTNSRFEYINPPQNSESRTQERDNLEKSILFDSYTPDFSYDNLKGMGSLSGVALKNALILGYIKRENRMEIYDELIDRDKNVILSILSYINENRKSQYEELEIEHEFSDPFEEDIYKKWEGICKLKENGLASLEQCVKMLSLTDAPEEEINRLKEQTIVEQ